MVFRIKRSGLSAEERTLSENWIKSVKLPRRRYPKKTRMKKSDDSAEMLTLLTAVEHLNDLEQE